MSSEALFDFVGIDQFVMPNLHLILGIVNYLYKNMVEESHASCEDYSLDYAEVKRIWELSDYDTATSKTSKKIQATKRKYKRQVKRDIRGEEDEEQQNFMEAELE